MQFLIENISKTLGVLRVVLLQRFFCGKKLRINTRMFHFYYKFQILYENGESGRDLRTILCF